MDWIHRNSRRKSEIKSNSDLLVGLRTQEMMVLFAEMGDFAICEIFGKMG